MAIEETLNVATDETKTLISPDKVEDTAVYNRTSEKLCSIHTMMVDKISGKVTYATMSFGGFLGIGDRYHPLLWQVLTYDTHQGGYVVDLDLGIRPAIVQSGRSRAGVRERSVGHPRSTPESVHLYRRFLYRRRLPGPRGGSKSSLASTGL